MRDWRDRRDSRQARYSSTPYTAASQTNLYRSRHGMILGVCKGIARYFDCNVFWVRCIAVVFFIFSGFWPLGGIYLLAALLMKPAPVIPLETTEEQEFYDSYASSRGMALQRLKRTFDKLDRRIQRLEHMVTTRESDWDRRLNGS